MDKNSGLLMAACPLGCQDTYGRGENRTHDITGMNRVL